MDIVYAPFVERFQPFFSQVKNYEITEGRPELGKWLEECPESYENSTINCLYIQTRAYYVFWCSYPETIYSLHDMGTWRCFSSALLLTLKVLHSSYSMAILTLLLPPKGIGTWVFYFIFLTVGCSLAQTGVEPLTS